MTFISTKVFLVGYKLIYLFDLFFFSDVNECTGNIHSCSHFCINTNGSYTCGCPPGYALTDNTNCGDVDECAANNGGCSGGCVNTIGSYICSPGGGSIIG